MKTKYTIPYFIKKFSNPRLKWTDCGNWQDEDGAKCALAHCGRNDNKNTKKANALSDFFSKYDLSVTHCSDGANFCSLDYTVFGNSPAERILVALTNMKFLEK